MWCAKPNIIRGMCLHLYYFICMLFFVIYICVGSYAGCRYCWSTFVLNLFWGQSIYYFSWLTMIVSLLWSVIVCSCLLCLCMCLLLILYKLNRLLVIRFICGAVVLSVSKPPFVVGFISSLFCWGRLATSQLNNKLLIITNIEILFL